MSQNKTVIQGLEPNVGSNQMNNNQSFYTRSSANHSYNRGTVVPGMTETTNKEEKGGNSRGFYNQGSKKTTTKPIVGFLYSISKTAMGEYWPLQMGRNTIGQSPESDIVLAEGTVSSSHAVLVTRQVKSGIIAAITDSQSTNGTMINGEIIGFSAEECHNGDIITIGNNYQFLLLLIDSAKIGLSVNKDFISITNDDEDDNIADEDPTSFQPGAATRPGGFNPYESGPTNWGGMQGGNKPNDGTVGIDGSYSGGNSGGTISM